MKRLAVLAATLILAGHGAAAEPTTIVHAGTLLAVPGNAPVGEQSIIIRNGRIAEIRPGFVTPADLGDDGADAQIVDLSKSFVLPGLIDSHTHLAGQLGPNRKINQVIKSNADYTLDAAMYARRTLEAGFTTVRNVGTRQEEVIFALRDAIASGKAAGPRIVAGGASISATGGHGDVHGFRDEVLAVLATPSTCDGADDCRRAVRAKIKRGSDIVKITATGGVLSETAAGTGQQLFDDELVAIVETAHSLGRKVAAHAHGVDGINAALRAGVDSIEHGTFGNQESFRLYKQTGAYLVPTILAGVTVAEMAVNSTFMAPSVREKSLLVGPQMLDMVRRAHRAGVKIAFGTDSGVSKHGENAREFALMVEAGMTPMEAIVAATVNASDLLSLSGEIGTLEPGKAADLIATAGSPLEDISELSRVTFVMRNGVTYKHQ